MRQIKVLYQDDCCVVFDKPSGLIVTPAPHQAENTLTYIVNQQCASAASMRLHPCHRLDKETSGAIIYGWGKQNQKQLMGLFYEGKVSKTYIAMVKGRVAQRQGTIRSRIQDTYQRYYAAKSPGKLAVTHYRVLKYHSGFTFLEVVPETGRTHQIRIHFARMGHPILGEGIYAFRKDFDAPFKRLALHCHRMSWPDPKTGKTVSVEAEIPPDLRKLLGRKE